MQNFSQVTIVGCGLIGGSFALALRRAGFVGRITACGGTRAPYLALERGIVDGLEESFAQARTCDADLIYLAAPIGAIIDFLRSRGGQIKPGAMVTDAGSTKVEVCRVAGRSLPREVCFVGGHPMAGSEHSGIEYARADLFDRAIYALAKEPSTDPKAFERMQTIVSAIGARPVPVDPAEHDRATALISHLPQLLSTSLAALLGPESENRIAPRALAQELAATGWSDTTRLAMSPWSVWRDIILTNQPNISSALSDLIAELQTLEEALNSRDFNFVRELFQAANVSIEEQRSRRYQAFEKL